MTCQDNLCSCCKCCCLHHQGKSQRGHHQIRCPSYSYCPVQKFCTQESAISLSLGSIRNHMYSGTLLKNCLKIKFHVRYKSISAVWQWHGSRDGKKWEHGKYDYLIPCVWCGSDAVTQWQYKICHCHIQHSYFLRALYLLAVLLPHCRNWNIPYDKLT